MGTVEATLLAAGREPVRSVDASVAQYERPKPGYDAMIGFGGMFVGVPSGARVRVAPHA